MTKGRALDARIVLLGLLTYFLPCITETAQEEIIQQQREIADAADAEVLKNWLSNMNNGLTDDRLLKDLAHADKIGFQRAAKGLSGLLVFLDATQDIADEDYVKFNIDVLGATAGELLTADITHLATKFAVSFGVASCVTMAKLAWDSCKQVQEETAKLEISSLFETLYADPVVIPRPTDSIMKTSRLTLIDNKNPDVLNHLYEKLFADAKFAARFESYAKRKLGNDQNVLPLRYFVKYTGTVKRYRGTEVKETVEVPYSREEYLASIRADKAVATRLQSLMLDVNREIRARQNYRELIRKARELSAKVAPGKAKNLISLLETIHLNGDNWLAANTKLLEEYNPLLELIHSSEAEYKGDPAVIKAVRDSFETMKRKYAGADIVGIMELVSPTAPGRARFETSIRAGLEETRDPSVAAIKELSAEIRDVARFDPATQAELRDKLDQAIRCIKKDARGLQLEFEVLRAHELSAMLREFETFLAKMKPPEQFGPQPLQQVTLATDDTAEVFTASVVWRKTVSFREMQLSGPVENDVTEAASPKIFYVMQNGRMKVLHIDGPMFWDPLGKPKGPVGAIVVRALDVKGNMVKEKCVTLSRGTKQIGYSLDAVPAFRDLAWDSYLIGVFARGYEPIMGRLVEFDPAKTPETTIELVLKKEEPMTGNRKMIVDLPFCKYWVAGSEKPVLTGFYYTQEGQKIDYTSLPLFHVPSGKWMGGAYDAGGLVLLKSGTGYHIYPVLKHAEKGFLTMERYQAELKTDPGFKAVTYLVVNRMKGAECAIILNTNVMSFTTTGPDDMSKLTVKYLTEANGNWHSLDLD